MVALREDSPPLIHELAARELTPQAYVASLQGFAERSRARFTRYLASVMAGVERPEHRAALVPHTEIRRGVERQR